MGWKGGTPQIHTAGGCTARVEEGDLGPRVGRAGGRVCARTGRPWFFRPGPVTDAFVFMGACFPAPGPACPRGLCSGGGSLPPQLLSLPHPRRHTLNVHPLEVTTPV